MNATKKPASVVWLRCEWTHWAANTLSMMLPTAVVAIASWYLPEIRFLAGVILGLWLGMAHNCIWAYMSRKSSLSNADVLARPDGGPNQ